MSARQYTVAIKLVDKDNILTKLSSMGRGSSSSGGSTGGGGGGILDKLAGLGATQVLKIAGVGLGIAELVKLGVKSSNILQANFKLWENAMLLIFRPFADFIGLLLRPFAILMMQFSIPFFKAAYPLFRDYGLKIGQFFSDPSTALATLAEAIGGAVALALATKLPFGSGGGGVGGSGGGYNGGGGVSPSAGSQCIELCDKTVSRLPKPLAEGVGEGIRQSSLVPNIVGVIATVGVTNAILMDMKTDIRVLKETVQGMAKPPTNTPENGGAKHFNVELQDTLSVKSLVGDDVMTSIKTDWGQVATASGAAAVAGAAAASALDEAKTAIAGAVSRLQSFASTIPNEYAWGFAQFGGTGVNTVGATRGRTQMAQMAQSVNI